MTDGAEFQEILARLRRLDGRARGAPWTRRVLELVGAHPGVRAADLRERVGQERERFKRNVRKLKALGLTESLRTGYRLSSRGATVLDRLRSMTQAREHPAERSDP